MALTGRIGKLEDKAAVTSTAKGVIADWALEYVRESDARLREGRTGEIMRELGISPDPEEKETAIIRKAQHLTETYPNLEACRRGEANLCARSQEILAKLTSRAAGIDTGIDQDPGEQEQEARQ